MGRIPHELLRVSCVIKKSKFEKIIIMKFSLPKPLKDRYQAMRLTYKPTLKLLNPDLILTR